MKRLILALIIASTALMARGQNAAISGYCYQGATQASVAGIQSNNYLQGIVPSCSVLVYLAGTHTQATLYSSVTGGSLPNPFPADLTGNWIFFSAINQAYDVVLYGGTYPNIYPQAQYIYDLYSCAPGSTCSGGGGGIGNIVWNVPTFMTATPSTISASGTQAFSFNSQSQALFLASPAGTSGSPSFRAISASDVPTLNQNTTGAAANITAVSNATLVTLSSLQLPYSQLTGTVPTWNQNTAGNAATATQLAATPSLCSTGFAPTGVMANGNATGCASISSGSGPTIQTNGTNNASQTTLNFVNPANFNGLVLAFSNPSSGNVTFAISGALTNAGLANSSITVGTSTVSLGATLSALAGLTSISTGSGSTACGSATGCFAATEGSTAGTPTPLNDYLRADSTTHRWLIDLNGGSEFPIMGATAQGTPGHLWTVSSSGYDAVDGGAIPVGGVSSVSNSDGTLTTSPTTGAVVASVNLAHAFTWTAAHIFSVAGAASTPPILINGAWYTGGSGTTNLCQETISPSAATQPTGYSTTGSGLCINAPSGAGHALDVFNNGPNTLVIFPSGTIQPASGAGFNWASRSKLASSADGLFSCTNNAGTTWCSASIGQIVGVSSAAPTCTVGTGAGTGATCSVTGNNIGMVVTVNTGTTPASSATLVTITYNGTLPTAPIGCGMEARNVNALGQVGMVYTTAPTTTTFTMAVGGTNIPASTSGFSWYLSCI